VKSGDGEAAVGALEPVDCIRDATSRLCRVIAQIDLDEVNAVDAPQLASQIVAALHALYEAQGVTTDGSLRQVSALGEAERLLAISAESLRSQVGMADPIAANVVAAAGSIRALREQLRQGASALPQSTLQWEPRWHKDIGVHRLQRSALVPPVKAPEEPTEAADELEPPPLSIDELKAMAASALEDGGDEGEQEASESSPGEEEDAVEHPQSDRVSAFADKLLKTHLAELSQHWRTRPRSTWRDLARREALIVEHVDAIVWLGPPAVQPLVRALIAAEQPGDSFAAAIPLLSIEGADAADAVLRALETCSGEARPGLLEALRLGAHSEIVPRLARLIRLGPRPPVSAAVIKVLGERGAVDDGLLEKLVSDPDPLVVAAAAESVVRNGPNYATARIEYMAEREYAEPAATTLLWAASILGSARTRSVLRKRLRSESNPPIRLVEAIAASGDESDVDLLVSIAHDGEEEAVTAALRALGWLGAEQALPAIDEFIDGELADEAKQAIARITGPDRQARLGAGRWLAGRPWSAAQVVTMLADPEAPGIDRDLTFRELVARTGLHVPFDSAWPVMRQRQAAAMWTALIARQPSIPEGTWIYRGEAVTAATRG